MYLPPKVKPLSPPLRQPRYADVLLGTVDHADGTPRELRFDVYQHPEQTEPGPTVVYFFGGGWSDGDYKQRTSQKAVYIRDLVELTDRGLTVVSASYRLLQEAPFPACVHDAKGLIRHLKARAADYLIDPERIGVLGNSAGGHLAAMVALSSGDRSIEGTTGGNLDQTSDVAAGAIYYAPTDLGRFGIVGDASGSEVDHLAEGAALGPVAELLRDDPELLRQYSPVHHAHQAAPPLLVLHGGADPLVPIEQSRLLVDALTASGADVTHLTYSLGAHGPSLGPAIDGFAYEFLISRLTEVR